MSSYDTADNLVSDIGTTRQFNAADELCWTVPGSSSNACGTAPTGATTYGYDPRGNRTSQVPPSGAATCSAYDQADRLTSLVTGTGSSCQSPTTVATYGYDASGLRMSKRVGGSTTTEPWDVSGSLPLLLSETSGGVATDYAEAPGGLPLEQISAGATLWYHHDQLGSTRVITNASGAGVATYQYDPYGTTVSSTGRVANPLRYAGQYKDVETELYYLRARYYDPKTAQFLAVDGAVAKTMQSYSYASANPVNLADPTGLHVDCEGGAWLGNNQCGPPPYDPPYSPPCPQPVAQGSATVLPHFGGDVTIFGIVPPDPWYVVIRLSNGGSRVISIPGDWTATRTDNDNGWTFQDPNSPANVRIMEPDSRYPEGYIRIQTAGGNYLNENFENADDQAAGHLPIDSGEVTVDPLTGEPIPGG